MNEQPDPDPDPDPDSAPKANPAPGTRFTHEVETKVRRKMKARRRPDTGLWFGLGMMGLIGWAIVVPTLVGTAVGLWLDRHHPGNRSWTLALLVAGLMIGCFNAWMWVAKEHRAMLDEDQDENE